VNNNYPELTGTTWEASLISSSVLKRVVPVVFGVRKILTMTSDLVRLVTPVMRLRRAASLYISIAKQPVEDGAEKEVVDTYIEEVSM
jgi:hypothetical protein